MSRRRFKSLPSQPITTEITGLSHEGRGISHINGKITFLLGGLPGEEVEFIYTRQHGQFDEGKVTQILKAAPDRRTPNCAHFLICGGCSLQHLDPAAQIIAKQTVLLEQLKHIGGVQPETILPPLLGNTWGYRRKARLGVKYVAAKSKVLVGFRELNGRFLVDMESCSVLHPAIGMQITALQELIANLEAYQSIAQIEVAIGDNVTALIFRHLKPLSEGDLNQLSTFAQQKNIHLYLQPGAISSIHKLWPQDDQNYLTYALPDQHLELRFHPSDFTQINSEINQQMINRAIELLKPSSAERILDLFCGLGNFTLPLARYCKEIIGIEGDAGLVQRGIDNARLNHISNANFYSADLTQDFQHTSWAQTTFDKILLDPPRTGALEIVKKLALFKPKLILYVSCNPATLARDAGELVKQGYKLSAAGVMDMFPHTSHVESMALFQYA